MQISVCFGTCHKNIRVKSIETNIYSKPINSFEVKNMNKKAKISIETVGLIIGIGAIIFTVIMIVIAVLK